MKSEYYLGKIWKTRFSKKMSDDDERTKMLRRKDLTDKIFEKILDDDERTKMLRRKDLADKVFEKNLG